MQGLMSGYYSPLHGVHKAVTSLIAMRGLRGQAHHGSPTTKTCKAPIATCVHLCTSSMHVSSPLRGYGGNRSGLVPAAPRSLIETADSRSSHCKDTQGSSGTRISNFGQKLPAIAFKARE